ncbi:class I glutamine amidotransferase-like protein [Aspergillus stella-maris]|uniref:class I glutamine amidotransferase-like protein n=1 Tax=Aspergillus stella-maris TaxID=1810926 RepID=UPI003CCDC909
MRSSTPEVMDVSTLNLVRPSSLKVSAMFDLYSDPESISLIETFALAKKPIASVCHGPAILLRPILPSGEPLIASATVTGFSNLEEDALGTTAKMPFLLEDEMHRLSGKYVKAEETFGEKVVVSEVKGLGGVLITGQNPASAKRRWRGIGRSLGVVMLRRSPISWVKGSI